MSLPPDFDLPSTLAAFYNDGTPNEAKPELGRLLEIAMKTPGSWPAAVTVLQESADQFMLFFATNVLEHAIQTEWESIPIPQRQSLREFLLQCLAPSKALPAPVAGKVYRLLALIGGLQWPDEDPQFLDRLMGYVGDPATTAIGLPLLNAFMDEIAQYGRGNILPGPRVKFVRQNLKPMIPALVDVLQGLLHKALAGTFSRNDDVAISATASIRAAISTFHSTAALTPELFSVLFAVAGKLGNPLDASAKASGASAAAVECLVEIVNNCAVPAGKEAIIGHISGHLNKLLTTLTREDLDFVSVDCDFVRATRDLLAAMFRKHMNKLHQHFSAELQALLAGLYQFTLHQADNDGFIDCVAVWRGVVNIFVDIADEGGAAGSLHVPYVAGLTALLDVLLQRVLFATSPELLGGLDDEDYAPPNTEDATSGLFGDPAGLMDDEDEDERAVFDVDDMDLAGYEDVDEEEQQPTETELQFHMRTCLHLISKLCSLPELSSALASRIPAMIQSAVEVVLKQLEEETHTGDNEASVRDCGTLLKIYAASARSIARVTDQSITLGIVPHVLSVARSCASHHAHSRSYLYAQLQTQSLQAINSFWHPMSGWLSSGGDTFVATTCADVCQIIVSTFDARLVSAPASVLDAAAGVLWTIAAVPLDVHAVVVCTDAFKWLAANALMVCSPLPLPVQANIVGALTRTLLRHESAAEATAAPELVAGLHAMFGTVAQAVANVVLQCVADARFKSARLHMKSMYQHRIRRGTVLVSAMSTACRVRPAMVKAVAFAQLRAVLQVLVDLVRLYLDPVESCTVLAAAQGGPPQLSAATISMASDLIGALTQVLDAFRHELDPDWIAAMLDSLIGAVGAAVHHTNTFSCVGGRVSAGVLLLARFLKFVRTVADETSLKNEAVVQRILHMCLVELQPLLGDATIAVHLQPGFFFLLRRVLLSSFRYFVHRAVTSDMQQPTHTFRTAEAGMQFRACFELIRQSMLDESLAPAMLKLHLVTLLSVNQAHALFRIQPFVAELLPSFITVLLKLLLNQTHALLSQELCSTLHAMARVDMARFTGEYLLTFVSFVPWIRDAREVVSRTPVPASGINGEAPFASCIEEILTDVRCTRQ